MEHKMDYANIINQSTEELSQLRDSIKNVYASLEIASEEDCNLILLDTVLLIRQHRADRRQQLVELQAEYGDEIGKFNDV